MKSLIPDWLPKLFVKAEGSVREATTKKFSDFNKITDTEGMEVVGIKAGANVRADFPVADEAGEVTTSMVALETDDPLRNAKGQFMPTKELPELVNQKDANRFIASELQRFDSEIEGIEKATGEHVKKTGDEMTGDLEMVKTDGFDPKVHTRWLDSSENSNLHIQHNGNTRIYVGREEVSITRPLQLNQEGVESNHAVTKGYVDGADRLLQAEIEEIALALGTLLVQREHGQWKYIGFSGENIPRNAGEFALAWDDLSSPENIITLNPEDMSGITHGFADVEVGDYVEIVDLDEPNNYVLFVVTSVPEGVGISNINVALKDKGQNFLVGETCEIRFFAISEQDINLTDLDNRYAPKSHGHDTFINNGGETTLSETTHIYAGSSGKWMNIQQATNSTGGFFVFRDYSGNNIFQVGGDGVIKLQAGRMASDADEITTKRYVDSKVGSAGHPGRRFKFTGYSQGSSVAAGCFSPVTSNGLTEDLYLSYQDYDGLKIIEASPDFTPGITMPITVYTLSNGIWKGVGFATWGGSKTDYYGGYIRFINVTWKQKPVLAGDSIYAIVVGGRW